MPMSPAPFRLAAFAKLAGAALTLGSSLGTMAADPAGAVGLGSHASEVQSPAVLASELLAQPAERPPDVESVSRKATDEAFAAGDLTGNRSRWISSASLSGQHYQWSLSRGAIDLGLKFGIPAGTMSRPDGARAESPAPFSMLLPSISVGLRREAADPFRAGSLLSRVTEGNAVESYASKVGVEWKPAESQMNFVREGLGLRLEGNDRMTVRLRKGVLGIYMHHKF